MMIAGLTARGIARNVTAGIVVPATFTALSPGSGGSQAGAVNGRPACSGGFLPQRASELTT